MSQLWNWILCHVIIKLMATTCVPCTYREELQLSNDQHYALFKWTEIVENFCQARFPSLDVPCCRRRVLAVSCTVPLDGNGIKCMCWISKYRIRLLCFVKSHFSFWIFSAHTNTRIQNANFSFYVDGVVFPGARCWRYLLWHQKGFRTERSMYFFSVFRNYNARQAAWKGKNSNKQTI